MHASWILQLVQGQKEHAEQLERISKTCTELRREVIELKELQNRQATKITTIEHSLEEAGLQSKEFKRVTGAIQERIDEMLPKHAREFEEFEGLKATVDELKHHFEKQGSALEDLKLKSALDWHHATLKERVDYIESTMEDSTAASSPPPSPGLEQDLSSTTASDQEQVPQKELDSLRKLVEGHNEGLNLIKEELIMMDGMLQDHADNSWKRLAGYEQDLLDVREQLEATMQVQIAALHQRQIEFSVLLQWVEIPEQVERRALQVNSDLAAQFISALKEGLMTTEAGGGSCSS